MTIFVLYSWLDAGAQLSLTNRQGRKDTVIIGENKTLAIFNKPIPTLQQPNGIIPQDYYTRNFGFFCKQELKMHQAHIPVSFRLGSFEYNDMLEQKGCKK